MGRAEAAGSTLVVDNWCICTYLWGMGDPVASACVDEAAALPCHCHSLRQAARRATALYDAAMAPYGLRISQFSILSRLGRHGPLSVQALAAALVLDRTTLGRNLRPLERDGLVASETDAADKRVRRLGLTEAGRSLLEAARPAWREAQAAFERDYGRSRAAALQQELSRLTQVLVVPERIIEAD
jgi:DNA-binding MarR family transcriptional regulator